MKNNYLIILLVVINLIAGFAFINEGLFYHDSVILAQSVERTFESGKLQPQIRGRFGSVIVNLIISLPSLLLGHSADFPTRFSSVLFQALSIAALFIFLRMLFSSSIIALFTSLLFSFTPLYFMPNTYGKEHGMAIFFLLSSFIVLLRGLKNRSVYLVSLASIIFVFSITVREAMLIATPLFFILFFNHQFNLNKEPKLRLRLLFYSMLTFLVALNFIIWAYLGNELCKAMFSNDFAGTRFMGLFSFTSYSILLKDISWAVLLLLFMLFIIGILKMLEFKKRFLVVFFLSWFLFFMYIANTDNYCARFLDMAVIPFYVFISFALSNLYSKDKVLSLSLVVYLVLVMFIFMLPMLQFRHKYNGQKQFALYVKQNTENNAIIIAMDDSPFIQYYGKRKTVAHPIDNPVENFAFLKRIKGYINIGIPVYLISSGLSYDSGGAFREALLTGFDVKFVGQKLTEDYHRTEHKFSTYLGKLLKISLKNKK